MAAYLDPAPLGLPPSALDRTPDSARVIREALTMLDGTVPELTGCDPYARAMLAAAQTLRDQVDVDFEHSSERWPSAEQAFLGGSSRSRRRW